MSEKNRKSSTELLSELGERIRLIRRQKGMTQTELSGADVTRNMLSRIENGAALPSLPTLCGIADRLGVPVGALLGDLGEYRKWNLAAELNALARQKKYSRMIDYFKSNGDQAYTSDIAALMSEAYLRVSEEHYRNGKLSLSREYSETAEAFAQKASESDRARLSAQIYLQKKLVSFCPSLYTDDTPKLEEGICERLGSIIFDGSTVAVYLYALAKLDGLTHSAYSMPIAEAPALCSELAPMAAKLSDKLYRTHIEAKLDLINADYLGAKAKLMTTLDEAPPPAVLYDIFRDLEFCCKCCGDFENAYKYSGARLELSKKLV